MDFSFLDIKGLESYSDFESHPYIYLVTSMKQLEDLKEKNPATTASFGDAYDSKTGDIIAKCGQPMALVCVKYYKVWNVWKERKLVKYTFDINGVWSDGSKVVPSDLEWIPNPQKPGKKMSQATETHCFVVCTKDQLAKETPEYRILAIGMTNKSSKDFVKRLMDGIKVWAKNQPVENRPAYFHDMALELTSGKETNDDGDIWYGWQLAKVTHKIKPETSKKLIPVYEEVREFDAPRFTLDPTKQLAAAQMTQNSLMAPSNTAPMPTQGSPFPEQQTRQAIQPPSMTMPDASRVIVNAVTEF